MVLTEYEQFVREYMDMEDRDTLKTIALTLESNNEQNQVLSALAGELYNKIQKKADKINFTSISKSRGDITKIENYESLSECVTIIHDIVEAYKQDTTPIDVVSTAIENLKSRTAIFKKAFAIDAKLPMMIYNNIGLAIVSSVSFMIATCIEYIKSPNADTFETALNTTAYAKTRDNLLFQSLQQFNATCKDRSLDEALDTVMKQKKINMECACGGNVNIASDSPFLSDEDIDTETDTVIHDDKETSMQEGVLFTVGRAIMFVMKLLVNIIRSIIYYFYYTKQKISDYFAVQADLLEMNAYKLQYNTAINNAERKKIYDKQMKVAERWRKWSNKFNVDYNVSAKAAVDGMSKDYDKNSKYTVNDLDDYNPNSEENPYKSSSLF